MENYFLLLCWHLISHESTRRFVLTFCHVQLAMLLRLFSLSSLDLSSSFVIYSCKDHALFIGFDTTLVSAFLPSSCYVRISSFGLLYRTQPFIAVAWHSTTSSIPLLTTKVVGYWLLKTIFCSLPIFGNS